MDEIFRNKYLNYGYLTMLTGMLVVGFIMIHHGDYSKFTSSIKLSMFNIKLVLSLVIIATYLTFAIPSARMIVENKVKLKTPPRGDRGVRGNRGKIGKDAACSACGDDLCYKKLLYNITKTINFWRQNNNMELFEQNYIIPNEFIKDKIKKHCSSAEFKELLNKYGSNNDNTNVDMPCPETICENAGDRDCAKKCGAYDYMFKMWSIWILIILRYKNGMFFLESEGLNERDFNGLVEKEDAFQVLHTAKLRDENNTVVRIIDNSEFPFYTIEAVTSPLPRDTDNPIHISKLIINDTVGANTDMQSWIDMFKYDTYTQVQNEDGNNNKVKEIIERLDMVRRNNNGDYSFKCINLDDSSDQGDNCINMDFIKVIGRVPGGGLQTPFDEIKNYKSWYWGSDSSSKENIKFKTTSVNKICEICSNSSLCSDSDSNSDSKMGIRVRITNSYKLLVDTEYFQNVDGKPFKSLDWEYNIDSNPVSIFAVNHLTDHNEHPLFSEYKPVGDVILPNNTFIRDRNTQLENVNKCKPSDDDLEYEGPLFTPIIGTGAKDGVIAANKTDRQAADALQIIRNHVYTMLVSGPDLKPPVGYEPVSQTNKSEGINKGYETINIWRPIPPTGYAALGYVVDMRPSDVSNPKPKPSKDRIFTVPQSALRELRLINQTALQNINLFKNTAAFSDYIIPAEATEDNKKHICIKSSLASNPSISTAFKDTSPSANHDKKYSIMRVYEEDEFND